MASRNVLLITSRDDVTTDLVVLALEKRGEPFHRLDTDRLLQYSFARDTAGRYELRDPESRVLVAPDMVRSVYVRRPGAARPLNETAADATSFVIRECQAFLRGLYEAVDEVPWISPLHCILRAENKLWQLQVARSLGLHVPNTIVTNDPGKVESFIRRERNVVVKALSSGALNEKFVSYTSEVHGWDDTLAKEITLSPHLFQAQIAKAADVRVTIVGERVFACRILSQAFEETRVDFRRFRESVPCHAMVDLPARLTDMLVSLVKLLGLRFGAIDLVEDEAGGYWFLEINPNGQWGWIEQLTGAPIADSLADLLLSSAQREIQ